MYIDEFKIEEWMNKYEDSAVVDLTATTISPLSVNELLKIAGKKDFSEIADISLGYGSILGSERLLKNISSLYQNQQIENITLTHGAIGANQLVFASLLDNADEVISIVPNYQQHSSIPKALGATVKEVFLKEYNRWQIDIDEIRKNITSKTKLITFSNPNNPTGALISEKLMFDLINLAKENDIWILADEVYRGLNLFGERYSKSFADVYKKGISVCSMSKTFSLPGIRLGWICAEKSLIEIINRHRQYNTISMSLLDDYLACLALESRKFIEERNLEILRKNYDILKNSIIDNEFLSCILPSAGTTCLIKYNANIDSCLLCKTFQEKTGIALLPGQTMDMENYIRIGIGSNSQDLKMAISTLSDFISDTNTAI